MKRPHGKIKDFVEPQAFDLLRNVAADPTRALAAYRFTDVTSDLLVRWLDALADVPRRHAVAPVTSQSLATNNTTRALAGVRGVGKSHTLAAFAALAAMPELRSSVSDAHVATSARRLSGRRYTVARIERGSCQTLQEEIAVALASVFGGEAADYLAQANDDIAALLHVAASRLYDATLVLVIDTAYGRSTRVERDDGKLLSELAHHAAATNTFIALALDDDITGAEGANAALARAYRIDYLDPEHLFRIADAYVLKKNPNARAALHEIYLSLRQEIAGFNWSEPRFAALYPLHPIVADITSAVRLYAPTFALLPFAAETAQRAIGRPPLALVTLDEVFDRAEAELREAKPLDNLFAAYVELIANSIGRLPVMARLEARLILKALFVLSLDGRGATAAEICAAMLFEDAPPMTTNGAPARTRVKQALERFCADAPGNLIQRDTEAASATNEIANEPRYRFRIDTTSGFETALAEAIEKSNSDEKSLLQVLYAAAPARFADWSFGNINGDINGDINNNVDAEISSASAPDFVQMIDEKITTNYVEWRGTQREGCIVLRDDYDQLDLAAVDAGKLMSSEWLVMLLAPRLSDDATNHTARLSLSNANLDALTKIVPLIIEWRPAALTADERNTLRRCLALHRTPELFTLHGEHAHATHAASLAQVERIWARSFLDDGKLVITQRNVVAFEDHPASANLSVSTNSGTLRVERSWSDEAKASATLAEAFRRTLEEFFNRLYPQHPCFDEPLGEREIRKLITDLFGGANVTDAEVQRFAALFAVPLQLVVQRGTTLALRTGDELLNLKWVREVVGLAERAEGACVPLQRIAEILQQEPFGFGASVQRLLLASLVANRRLEFVTTNGDRISRRTLATSIKWETVAGIARPAAILQSAEELTMWARLLAEGATSEIAINETGGNSIANPATREQVRESLSTWLATWRAAKLLVRFAELSDDALTTRAADIHNAVQRSFDASAQAIDDALADQISLEEGLQRVADAFINSPKTFDERARQLAQLTTYVDLFPVRDWARVFLLAAEPTGVATIDAARRELLDIATNPHALFDEKSCVRFDELWAEFHPAYVETYAARHDAVMNNSAHRLIADTLGRGAAWREYEALAGLSLINHRNWKAIERVREQVRAANCLIDVREVLQTEPRCICAFRMTCETGFAHLEDELAASIEIGRATAHRTLSFVAPYIAGALEHLATTSTNSVAARAQTLSTSFKQGITPASLSFGDVQIIEHALAASPAPPAVRVALPVENHELLTPEELNARLTQWLDELPSRIAVVEVTHGVDEK